MKNSEKITKILLEKVIPNTQIKFVAEQSNNEYDFDIIYNDGHTDALETTEVTNPEGEAFDKSSPPLWKGKKDSSLKKQWVIYLKDKSVKLKPIKKSIIKYLAQLEKQNRFEFNLPRITSIDLEWLKQNDPILCYIYRLGIHSGTAIDGESGVYLGSVIGGLRQDDLRNITKECINKKKNKFKNLKDKNNHLFLLLNSRYCTFQLFFLFEKDEIDFIPELPNEIKCLWLAAMNWQKNEAVVWKYSIKDGWEKHFPILLSEEEIKIVEGSVK